MLVEVLNRSNKNDNSLKKHESISWLFLHGGCRYKQKKLIFAEVSVIDSRITLNERW